MKKSLMICSILSLLLLCFCLSGNLPAQPMPGHVEMDYAGKLSNPFTLPQKVNETSGLIHYAGGFWTFNDSGGEAEVYKINEQDGAIVQTVVLEGATNRDWEDICQDHDYIYLGDFGNNSGTRRDLKIYKVAKSAISDNPESKVAAQTIFFSYADQDEFSEENRNHDFDCEAVISSGDELILFTKNRGNGRTRMYKLSKDPGTYSISPVDEFEANGLITGADFHEESQLLVLVGYTNWTPFVYMFRNFDGNGLNSASVYRINLTGMAEAQTEGIFLLDETRIALTAERTKRQDQALYLVEISELLSQGRIKE